MPKRSSGPDHVKCGNPACGRTLDASEYAMAVPSGTPSDKVHRVVKSSLPDVTVFCTCGHYTVINPKFS